MAEHFVVAGLFDIEDLASERQDGLIFAVPPLFGGAAGGLPLDDEQLGPLGVLFLAVGKLTGQTS